MRTTLKQRHTMLDAHLEELIQQHPDLHSDHPNRDSTFCCLPRFA